MDKDSVNGPARVSVRASSPGPDPPPLRVVHVVPNLNEGGAEALVRALLPRLRMLGCDVAAVSIYPSRLTPAQREQLGVPVYELGRGGRRDWRFFLPLVQRLRTLRPDVVHTHVHTGKYAGRLAAIAARVPSIVFTEHDSAPATGWKYRLPDTILGCFTARTIVFTRAQAEAVARSGVARRKIAVIPNGIDTAAAFASREAARAAMGIVGVEPVLLWAGRLSREKNPQLALRAMAAGAPGTLVVAGDGPEREAIHALAGQLALGERVRFLGHRTDMPSLFPGADLFVHTSLREAMPLAVLEAMNAGVPVITTPWRAAEEFVPGGVEGTVVPDWEPVTFAAAVTARVAELPISLEDREQLRAWAARFSIDRCAERHVELYAELTGRNPSNRRCASPTLP